MKTVTFLVASIVLMAGTSAPADADNGYGSKAYHADSRHPGDERGWRDHDDYFDPRHIDNTQRRQRDAIAQGVRRGLLTEREADRLIREQRDIERLQRRLESDGRLTAQELARLERELDESRSNIRRQISDDDRSYRRYGYVCEWYRWR